MQIISTAASLAEINPLILTGAGEVVALDAKMNFDDNAMFRRPHISELRDHPRRPDHGIAVEAVAERHAGLELARRAHVAELRLLAQQHAEVAGSRDSIAVTDAVTDSLHASARPVVPDSLKTPDSLETPDSLAVDSVPPSKKELRRLERVKKQEAKRLEKEAKQAKKEEDRKWEELERKLREEKELQEEMAADSAGRPTEMPAIPDSLARDSLTALP